LVDALVERGAKVRVIDNLSSGKLENIQGHLDDKRIEFILGMDNYVEKQAQSDLKGSIDDIPVENETFDAVMSVWVLDDVYELRKAMSEVNRFLKESGYYFCIESQSTHIDNLPYDYFRMAPKAMIRLCKEYNLELVEYKSFSVGWTARRLQGVDMKMLQGTIQQR